MKQNHKFLSNWGVKVFSFMIALLVVLVVQFYNVTSRVVTIPLNVILPMEYDAESLVPETVDIVISGDESIIYLVEPAQILAYADFSQVSSVGISRAPVVLEYKEDIYKKNSISVKAQPSSVRILFSQEGVQ